MKKPYIVALCTVHHPQQSRRTLDIENAEKIVNLDREPHVPPRGTKIKCNYESPTNILFYHCNQKLENQSLEKIKMLYGKELRIPKE